MYAGHRSVGPCRSAQTSVMGAYGRVGMGSKLPVGVAAFIGRERERAQVADPVHSIPRSGVLLATR